MGNIGLGHKNRYSFFGGNITFWGFPGLSGMFACRIVDCTEMIKNVIKQLRSFAWHFVSSRHTDRQVDGRTGRPSDSTDRE